MSDTRINNCSRCGESAFCVSWEGKHMVRPQRVTRCRGYHAPGSGKKSNTCKTEVATTEGVAIKTWNETYGKIDKSEQRAPR